MIFLVLHFHLVLMRQRHEVKKQYDAFIQCWLNSMKCIVILYCGSLFADHFPSETLVEYFFESIKNPILI